MRRVCYIFVLLIIIGVSACEQVVGDLDLPDYQSKLVIDGWIEQGKYAEVTLTKSASYFADIDSAALREALVSTAKVSISDGEQSEVLTLFRNSNSFPPFYYRGTKIRGEVGKNYQLTIETRGELYQSTTSILPPPQFDSLWFDFEHENDSLATLKGTFTDNPLEKNYYRVFTQEKNKDEDYVPIYLSAIGDKFFNGQSITFNLIKGASNNSDLESDAYFVRGDTLNIRFTSIDRIHFDFWRTLEREVYSVGNPFASAGNEVLSSFGDKALGVWGGYGASYYRVIIK